MKKLIAAFEKDPSIKNAERLLLYIDKHPMTLALVDADQFSKIEVAMALVEMAMAISKK